MKCTTKHDYKRLEEEEAERGVSFGIALLKSCRGDGHNKWNDKTWYNTSIQADNE
jgi:hypothetical protein